jgi:hypothetical protein
MDIENQAETRAAFAEKSAEQLASEQNLNMHIDEQGEQEAQRENEANYQGAENAENALYGLISIMPIGLSIAGLKNSAAVWSDDVCKQVSRAALPVLRKYTFGQKIIAFLETGGGIEEFALVMALTPVIMATAGAYKLDMVQHEKEVKEAENEPAA